MHMTRTVNIDMLGSLNYFKRLLRKTGYYRDFVEAFCKEKGCSASKFNTVFLNNIVTNKPTLRSVLAVVDDRFIGLTALMGSETLTFNWKKSSQGFHFWANINLNIAGHESGHIRSAFGSNITFKNIVRNG